MKAGEIIEIEGEKFIAQNEINSCTGCYFNNGYCNEVKGIDCYADKIILIKIPVELLQKIEQLEKQIENMKNCYNCDNQIECDELWGRKHIDCEKFSEWEPKKC